MAFSQSLNEARALVGANIQVMHDEIKNSSCVSREIIKSFNDSRNSWSREISTSLISLARTPIAPVAIGFNQALQEIISIVEKIPGDKGPLQDALIDEFNDAYSSLKERERLFGDARFKWETGVA